MQNPPCRKLLNIPIHVEMVIQEQNAAFTKILKRNSMPVEIVGNQKGFLTNVYSDLKQLVILQYESKEPEFESKIGNPYVELHIGDNPAVTLPFQLVGPYQTGDIEAIFFGNTQCIIVFAPNQSLAKRKIVEASTSSAVASKRRRE